jgi:hypothetical protein
MDFSNKLALIKETKFEITDKETFIKSFSFIKQLKKITEAFDKKISEKGYSLMFDEDIKEITLDTFKIQRIDATESNEYDPRKVFEAFGPERAFPLLKVKAAELKLYLNMGLKNGAVTWEEARIAQEGVTKKRKKGFIKLVPNKK